MAACKFIDAAGGVTCSTHGRAAYACVVDERDRLRQGLEDLAQEAQATEDAGDFVLGVPARVQKILEGSTEVPKT